MGTPHRQLGHPGRARCILCVLVELHMQSAPDPSRKSQTKKKPGPCTLRAPEPTGHHKALEINSDQREVVRELLT